MKYTYPAIFKEEDGVIIVAFPYLEGCVTYGETIEEALEMAKEALEGYLESIIEREIIPNKPINILSIKTNNNEFTSLVTCDIDLSKYSKSVKKTLTIPLWLNDKAVASNINFSKVLQEALLEKLVM